MGYRLISILTAILIFCFSIDALAWHPMFMGRAPSGGCSASYGAELMTTQNCTAPSGITEANATTGWSSLTCNPFESTTTDPYLGTYHLSGGADGNLDNFYQILSLDASTVYKLSYQVRHSGSGGNWQCRMGQDNTNGAGFRYTITSSETTYSNKVDYFLFNVTWDTFACGENSSTNNGWVYIDAFSVKAATLCYGDELHTAENAASLGAEANATTGWTAINSLNSFVSDGTGAADGSYHLKADATTSPVANNGFNIDLASAPFSLQDSTKYFLRFKAKHIGAGDTWSCGFSSTDTGTGSVTLERLPSLLNTMTTYAEFGWSFTYSTSYRYFVCHEAGSNNNGGLYLDSFSIKAITGE